MDLSNVKPGDKLAIRRHGFVRVLTVERITQTRVICERGMTFNRKHGSQIGSGSYPAYAMIATEGDIIQARAQYLREQIGAMAARLNSMPLDKLEAIYALFTEKTEAK